MKSIILTHSMYQDQEVLYPHFRLQEEGTVFLVAEKVGKIKGILGTEIESNMTTATLNNTEDDYLHTFDLLVLPGGVKAMEKLRQDKEALNFVRHWFGLNKPIASICSGAQMLISARVLLKGRKLSAYPAMAVDVENAGAVFINVPVVVDGNIISSPHYNHMAAWMRATINYVYREKHLDSVSKYGYGPVGGSSTSDLMPTVNVNSGNEKPLELETRVAQLIKYVANRINYSDWFSIRGGHGWSFYDQLPLGWKVSVADKAVRLGYLEMAQPEGSGGYVRYRITRSGLAHAAESITTRTNQSCDWEALRTGHN